MTAVCPIVTAVCPLWLGLLRSEYLQRVAVLRLFFMQLFDLLMTGNEFALQLEYFLLEFPYMLLVPALGCLLVEVLVSILDLMESAKQTTRPHSPLCYYI